MSFLGDVARNLGMKAAEKAGEALFKKIGFKKGGRPRKQRLQAGGKVIKAGQAVKEALPELMALAKMAKSAVGLKRGGVVSRKARGGRMK